MTSWGSRTMGGVVRTLCMIALLGGTLRCASDDEELDGESHFACRTDAECRERDLGDTCRESRCVERSSPTDAALGKGRDAAPELEPTPTRSELCADPQRFDGVDVRLEVAGEVDQESGMPFADSCTGTPEECCLTTWVFTQYVLPCEGKPAIALESSREEPSWPVETIESWGGDDSFVPTTVDLGCKGAQCDAVCVPAAASDFRVVEGTFYLRRSQYLVEETGVIEVRDFF